MKRIIYIFCFLNITFYGLALHAQGNLEYQVKAAFLYNFSKYIFWSDGSNAPIFKIGVLGESEILDPLRKIAATKQVYGHKIVIENYKTFTDTIRSQILFIPAGNAQAIEAIMPVAEQKNILTVSEVQNFTKQGGSINLIERSGRVKLEISQKALSRAGLVAKSQLLKLAILTDKDES